MWFRRLFALVLVFALTACGGPPKRNTPEWNKALEDRDILVETTDVEGSNLQVVTAIGIMNVAPEVVWQVFADIGKFKDILERMEDSTEFPRQGDERIIEFVVNAPAVALAAGFNRIRIKASLSDTVAEDGSYRRGDFSMIEGNVARAYGSWVIEGWKGEKRSLVSFSMFIDFGDIYLPKSVVDTLAQEYLEDFLVTWGGNLRDFIENPENRIVYEQKAAKAAGREKTGPNLEGIDDFLQ